MTVVGIVCVTAVTIAVPAARDDRAAGGGARSREAAPAPRETAAARRPSAPRADTASLRRLLAREFARHPRMEAQDVYKLVYQAAMGSRHAGLDSAMAAAWLSREVAQVGPGPEEPVVDTISADGRMVRVNLRPFLAAGGSKDALLDAFLRTAREFRGSTAALRRTLRDVERLAGAGGLPLTRAVLRDYFERMRRQGWPAVEHSEAYEAAYRPAYRVVLAALVPRILPESPQ